MTKDEYDAKLAEYQTSTAPVEIKEAAIKALKAKFYGVDADNKSEILKSIQEGEADISDMGGF